MEPGFSGLTQSCQNGVGFRNRPRKNFINSGLCFRLLIRGNAFFHETINIHSVAPN